MRLRGAAHVQVLRRLPNRSSIAPVCATAARRGDEGGGEAPSACSPAGAWPKHAAAMSHTGTGLKPTVTYCDCFSNPPHSLSADTASHLDLQVDPAEVAMKKSPSETEVGMRKSSSETFLGGYIAVDDALPITVGPRPHRHRCACCCLALFQTLLTAGALSLCRASARRGPATRVRLTQVLPCSCCSMPTLSVSGSSQIAVISCVLRSPQLVRSPALLTVFLYPRALRVGPHHE